MDSALNKSRTKNFVNVYELVCDFCLFVKSRRDGLGACVRGRNRFLCAGCADRVGAISYADYFGLEEWTVLPVEETAA